MMKKLLLPILAIYLATHSVGCTSGDAKDEDAEESSVADDESFAEEGEEDFADGSDEAKDSEDGGDEEEDTEVADDDSDKGEKSEKGGEDIEDELADEGGEEKSDDIALDESDKDSGEDEEFPEDVAEESPKDSEQKVAGSEQPNDENVFTSESPTSSEAPNEQASMEPPPPAPAEPPPPSETSSEPPAPVAFAPLQKIKEAPFEQGGTMLNRVYLTRPNDTVKSISEKIYGKADHAKDLRKWNPGLKAAPRVGTKVYYSSPQNPQDTSRMLTFYEDVGVPPQVYMTKDGDNIRAVSKELLGHPDSWKEVWSTNPAVESKGVVAAGLELKYWPDGVATPPGGPANTMAGAEPPMDPNGQPQDPNAMANNMPPDVNPPGMGTTAPPGGDMPPPDPFAAAQQPPPPAPDTAPPPLSVPQPPPMADNKVPEPDPIRKKAPAAEAGPADADTTLLLGVGGVALILLVGVFVIMRKNRSRRIDLSQTQV